MFFEKVKSEGLSRLSYILGDGGVSAVVDPRRDVGEYLEIAGPGLIPGFRRLPDLTGSHGFGSNDAGAPSILNF